MGWFSSWLGIERVQQQLRGLEDLLPYESACLEAFRGVLSESEKAILDQQIKAADVIQRQAGGAKLVFFFDAKGSNEIPLFANQAADLHAADVFLASAEQGSGHKMRAKVFLHRGRFFSIEFPKRPRRYMEQHAMGPERLRVVEVKKLAQIG